MQNVSRNGSMLLNLTQHGRGDLDPQVIEIGNDIGAWLKINGEAVYSSRPFEVCNENSNAVCYTLLKPRFASDFPPSLSAHDIGLKDLIESAAFLGALPDVDRVTVSIAGLATMSLKISPPVKEALPSIERIVKKCL